MIGSFANNWGPTIAGAIVAIVGVLSGLATAFLTIRAQGRARREDHAQQRELAREERDHDLRLRQVESDNERRRRFEDETLSAAAELSGNLSAAYSRLTYVRQDRVSQDLDEIEALLREARNQIGRLSLLLGGRANSVKEAEVALSFFVEAVGYARKMEQLKIAGEETADAGLSVSKSLDIGAEALYRFYDSAREAGITAEHAGVMAHESR
jgi:hypothetical protein